MPRPCRPNNLGTTSGKLVDAPLCSRCRLPYKLCHGCLCYTISCCRPRFLVIVKTPHVWTNALSPDVRHNPYFFVITAGTQCRYPWEFSTDTLLQPSHGAPFVVIKFSTLAQLTPVEPYNNGKVLNLIVAHCSQPTVYNATIKGPLVSCEGTPVVP